MTILACEECGAVQAAGTEPADFCSTCGHPVRAEARCPWCGKRAPAGTYCRSCGCELVPPGLYAAARMLKAGGVDRFALAERTRNLPAGQAEDLIRRYEEQRAIVERCVDEVRRCEAFLVQRHFSQALENALVDRLPLDETELEDLREVDGGEPTADGSELERIAEESPFERTRWLAQLALFRTRPLVGRSFRIVCGLLGSEGELGVEAALALTSWRMWAPGPMFAGMPWWKHVERQSWIQALQRATSPGRLEPGAVGSWAAAAWAMALYDGDVADDAAEDEPDQQEWTRSRLRSVLGEGLTSPDRDLALSCALVLGPSPGGEGVLLQALTGRDADRRAAALYRLASCGSPRAEDALRNGSDDEKELVLRLLRPPIPGALRQAVRECGLNGNEPLRRLAATVLARSDLLDEAWVEAMVPRLVEHRDADTFEVLLRAQRLPCGGQVIEAVLEAGLHERLRDAAQQAVENGQVPVESLRRLLDQDMDAERRLACLRLAEGSLIRCLDSALLARVVSVIFGREPAAVRDDVCALLVRIKRHAPEGFEEFHIRERDIESVFGPGRDGRAAFLWAASRMITDEEALAELFFREWMADLLRYRFDEDFVDLLAAEERPFAAFVDALREAVVRQLRMVMSSAAQALWMLSTRASSRACALATMQTLKECDVPYDAGYWVQRTLEEAASSETQASS